jgi:hypothetical protein
MNETANTIKVLVSAKVDPEVLRAVHVLAEEDDRSISFMIDRLLKTNPQVQEALDRLRLQTQN